MKNLVNHPNGFSLGLAQGLGRLAAMAYGTPEAGPDLTIVEDFRTDTRALVCYTPACLVISFRGTVDLENWLLDLDVFKKALACGVMVHAGFLAAADALLPGIIAALLPAGVDKAKLKPIVLTGHSLGGALASLVALFLQREGLPVAGVYTFASPRVGNAAWRNAYTAALGDRSYRVIAQGDLVPLLPSVLDSYRHIGQEIMLEQSGRIVARPPHLWELAMDAWACFWALDRMDAKLLTRYHSIEGDYLRLLKVDHD